MKKRLKIKNILILINILFLLGCCIFYGSRMIHYYRIENPKIEDVKTLVELVTLGKNLTDNGDGLYHENDMYYYKGKNVNNYLLYSGRLFRIVSIDKSGYMKLITEELQTSMVWGYNQEFENSYVRNWLNDDTDSYKSFLHSLDNTQGLLVNTNTCVDETDGKTITCDKNYESTVGLLSVYEYNLAGASDSYLNIGSYWWTSNKDSDGNAWYVYKKGTVNNDSSSGYTYYSYGVRPTITINGKISNFKGTGTKNDPYEITFDKGKNLNDQYVGEYVLFNDIVWRIQETEEKYVKLASADGIKDKDYILAKYGPKNMYSADYGIGNYLNVTFYNSLKDKDSILLGVFNNGKYDRTNKYDLSKINEYTVTCNIGLLQIGDLFINDVEKYYLATRTLTSDNSIYQVLEDGKIYIGNLKEEMKIRPTLHVKPDLKIVSGSGTKDDPYKLG